MEVKFILLLVHLLMQDVHTKLNPTLPRQKQHSTKRRQHWPTKWP